MTESATELLASDRVVGCLLVVEAWVLDLDGCQTQLDGLIKQVTKHLESVDICMRFITWNLGFNENPPASAQVQRSLPEQGTQ